MKEPAEGSLIPNVSKHRSAGDGDDSKVGSNARDEAMGILSKILSLERPTHVA